MRGKARRELVREFIERTGRAPTPYVVRQLKRGMTVDEAIECIVNRSRERYHGETITEAFRRAYASNRGGYGNPDDLKLPKGVELAKPGEKSDLEVPV